MQHVFTEGWMLLITFLHQTYAHDAASLSPPKTLMFCWSLTCCSLQHICCAANVMQLISDRMF